MGKFLKAALLFAILAFCTTCATSPANTPDALPKAGDTIHGFSVSEVGRIDRLGADVVELSHVRTGARVIFVLNDDTNLGFSTCFHTEPADDTGMLHILEHAVCAASRKYPGRDVFFDAIAQAYLTGLNAWTVLSATNYYATSMDENQLETLADFYLDCAFDSAILTEPNYFYREGWRYELPTLEDDLTINGIVYNEMQGSYGNIYRTASMNLNHALFPDTYQSRASSGTPADIPNLSYDELIAFYKSCYSPANSVTMFYGDVDMNRFLAFLDDEYFSVVAPGDKAVISAAQPAFDAPVHVTNQFPVAVGSEDTGSVIYYSAVLSEEDSADYTNCAICSIVTDLLSDNSSPLMQALNASSIGSSYGAYVANVGTQLTLNFYAADADASRDVEFREIVLEKLTEMAKDGFNEEMMRSLFARAELSLRLERNSGSVATSLFSYLIWIQEMGNNAPLNAAKWYQKADALCTPGYAEERILDWVVNNPHAALVSTVPAPGLLEENKQALKNQLAQRKAAMTDTQKQALVDETAAFNEWVKKDTPQNTLQKISVVNPSTVQANWASREISVGTEGDVTVFSAPASMDMTAVSLYFDVGHLTDSELCRLKMLSSIVSASTSNHTQEEITMSMARLINSLSAELTVQQLENGYRPVYIISWYAPDESVEQSVDLAFELLLDTDLAANADLLAQSIDSAISAYRNPETVNTFARYLAAASMDGRSALFNKLNGMPYLAELTTAKTEYAAAPDAFIENLAQLRAKAFQRSGVHVMLVGDEDSLARAAILQKLDTLPETCAKTLMRDDISTIKNTAIVGSTQASYLMRGIVLGNPAQDVTGDKLVLNQLLRGEYLLPILRFQMGAYSTGLSLSLNGYWMAQYYRGGSVFEADKVIQAMPEFIENLDISQEELDAYKLPVISSLLTPSGELNDAMSEIIGGQYGFTREKRLALVEEIRGVTVQDIKALVPALRDMLNQSGLVVITSASELAGHEDMFDAIVQMP
jgi:Zn-dependent M16 (insulinase) family peptidase